jgi:hypothetical protein
MLDNSFEGRVFLNCTPVAGIAGTSEQILMSFSLPANSLCQGQQGLRIRAGFKNNSSDTVSWKLYFGSESITESVTTTTGGEAEIDVMRNASKSQLVVARGKNNATSVASAFTAATEDDTSAILIKLSATATSSGANATAQYLSVEFLQSA